ncbi:MAG: hypothetical protein D3919_03460 [Candidatus Electrothrix sp. AW5]|nr:hypothetical protein [Candidatus Electrothrix gigas]
MNIEKILLMGCCLSLGLSSVAVSAVGQTVEENEAIRTHKLNMLAQKFKEESMTEKAQAVQWAKEHNMPVIESLPEGGVKELQRILPDGTPIYYRTKAYYTVENLEAAKTVSTNKVWPGGEAGLSLDGTGMIVGEWDDWGVLTTHTEFKHDDNTPSRVTQKDTPLCKCQVDEQGDPLDNPTCTEKYPNCSEPPTPDSGQHATHVAGTLVAEGKDPKAKGMAYKAQLHTYDWTNDFAEMTEFAKDIQNHLVSNHSYGPSPEDSGMKITGWYDEDCKKVDEIVMNAENYLPVIAAGNEQQYCKENYDVKNGYDCVNGMAVAKNILAVGAVQDMPNGYSKPSDAQMTDFSNWGPTNDGRIKPDICGNGYELYSTGNISVDHYSKESGTSMASPNVAGSLVLLQQHYKNLHSGIPMKAATLKAAVIHTADEFGEHAGPDYQCGWGILNTAKAAQLITSAQANPDKTKILEEEYNGSSPYTLEITADDTKPLVFTLVWTDPAGTPPLTDTYYLDDKDKPIYIPDFNSTEKMLVNDLDMRVSDGQTTWQPYVLNNTLGAFENAATTGDNALDNVEQIVVPQPQANTTYTVTINNKELLTGDLQNFSLIVSTKDSAIPESNKTILTPIYYFLLHK